MNYIGSKYTLMPFLEESITNIVGNYKGVFADLFAGTGAVGSVFKQKGYKVIANDIQYYSYVLNRHLIENIPVISTPYLDTLNNLYSEEGFVYKNYCAGSNSGRNYFTDSNGQKCDSIRLKLEFLKNKNFISDDEYYCYLAGLINSIDKVANTASVYGAFLKHIKASANKTFTLELLPTITGIRGEVYNEDINVLINKIEGDILYLDPPYNSRQYCSNYHVLETIARYDNPKLNGVTGLRDSDKDKQKSAYCSKRTVAKTFDDLISNAKFKYIFLSYNNEGLMSIGTIKEIIERYGRYDRFAKEYHRFRADKENARNHKSDMTTEYLHVCIK